MMACLASELACHFQFNLQEVLAMSMVDFWDNITRPGGLSAAIDDIKELSNEIKQIAVEFVEDFDELLTTGFREMVIGNNNNYQTSSEMRADGREMINSLKTICLDKRGIDSTSREVLKVLSHDFPLFADSLAEFNGAEIDMAIQELSGDFKQLQFLAPDGLDRFRDKALRLITVPTPPTYKAPPPDEQLNRLGSVGIFTSDKRRRVAASRDYLARIVDYQKVIEADMAKHNESGVVFDSSFLASGVGDLIISLAGRYWSISCLDDPSRLSCLLLASAGIYNPLCLATKLNSEGYHPDLTRMLRELAQVDALTKSMLSEDTDLAGVNKQPIIKAIGLPLST